MLPLACGGGTGAARTHCKHRALPPPVQLWPFAVQPAQSSSRQAVTISRSWVQTGPEAPAGLGADATYQQLQQPRQAPQLLSQQRALAAAAGEAAGGAAGIGAAVLAQGERQSAAVSWARASARSSPGIVPSRSSMLPLQSCLRCLALRYPPTAGWLAVLERHAGSQLDRSRLAEHPACAPGRAEGPQHPPRAGGGGTGRGRGQHRPALLHEGAGGGFGGCPHCARLPPPATPKP